MSGVTPCPELPQFTLLGRASSFKNFFYRVRLGSPLPGKNDNMAAMTLAVGVAYREIYSWKAAILYRRFVCQGTPSFVALEKTGFFEEYARVAYTSWKASSDFMLAMFDVVKIHTHHPATDKSFVYNATQWRYDMSKHAGIYIHWACLI